MIVFLFSNFFNSQRTAQVKSIEDNINQNIMESEIEYALLADASCDTEDEGGNSGLIGEINTLSKRLEYMEQQRGTGDLEVIQLKKYYTLLQVKDYLLLRERARQCGQKPLSILYFYSNHGDCDDCRKMGYVLTAMRENYNNLHVYAFDYNIDLSAINTLKSIYHLDNKLPILVINRKAYYGFKTQQDITNMLPDLALYGNSTTTVASSTSRKK